MSERTLRAWRAWLAAPFLVLTLAFASACTTVPAAVPYAPVVAPAVLVEAWAGPVEEVRTDRVMTFYRAYGGGANRLGSWLSPTPPTSRQAVREALALPPENTAEFYSVVTVPAGTLMKVGVAAPAFDQPGGGRQVQLLELIPAESFSDPMPLP